MGIELKEKEFQLILDILEEIENANIPVGASMLSLKINTSQATIGRVLQYLDYEGYLEKQSNKGRTLTERGRAYLQSIKLTQNVRENTEELIRVSSSTDKDFLLDVLKARRILESETAYLAASKISKEQIIELEKVVEKQDFEKKIGRSGENEDLLFHKMIARISGNKVIEQILILILTQHNVYLKLSYINNQVILNTKAHRKIIKALAQNNPELASECVVEHIDTMINHVIKYYKNS